MIQRFPLLSILAIVVALIALGIASASDTATAAAPDTSPPSGKPASVNPKTTVIIDYTDAQFGGPSHPGPHGGGGGDGDDVDHPEGHYELLGGDWADADTNTTVVDPQLAFVIDLRGFPTGSGPAILAGFAAWEDVTSGDLLGTTSFADVTVAFGDGFNTYSMRNLGGRVLAATFITYNDVNKSGNLDTGDVFLEMDVVHNSTVSWAIAEDGGRGKWFDIQNVATHEIGHVFGLAHPGNAHPEDEEQTMFASAGPKETTKRTLEATGDIPGINDPLLGY